MKSDFVRKAGAFVRANIKPLAVAFVVFFVAKFFPPFPFVLGVAAFFVTKYLVFNFKQ